MKKFKCILKTCLIYKTRHIWIGSSTIWTLNLDKVTHYTKNFVICIQTKRERATTYTYLNLHELKFTHTISISKIVDSPILSPQRAMHTFEMI